MKTAISTACFYLEEETETALSLIKETGADVCAVHLQTFYEYRPEFAKRYAANLGGAEVCSVHTRAHNFEPQLFSPSRRVRGDGFYWLEQVMRSAQLFGAKKYVLKAPLVSGEEALQYLSSVYKFCSDCGIVLCVENSRGGILNTPSAVARIKSACPGILFSLNLSEAGRSACSAYLKAMSDSLSQVVVNAGARFGELVNKLNEVAFDGEIVIETPGFTQISQLKSLVNSLKSLI